MLVAWRTEEQPEEQFDDPHGLADCGSDLIVSAGELVPPGQPVTRPLIPRQVQPERPAQRFDHTDMQLLTREPVHAAAC